MSCPRGCVSEPLFSFLVPGERSHVLRHGERLTHFLSSSVNQTRRCQLVGVPGKPVTAPSTSRSRSLGKGALGSPGTFARRVTPTTLLALQLVAVSFSHVRSVTAGIDFPSQTRCDPPPSPVHRPTISIPCAFAGTSQPSHGRRRVAHHSLCARHEHGACRDI